MLVLIKNTLKTNCLIEGMNATAKNYSPLKNQLIILIKSLNHQNYNIIFFPLLISHANINMNVKWFIFNSFFTTFNILILQLFPLSLFYIYYSKSAQLPFST